MNEALKRVVRSIVPTRILEPVIGRYFRVRWSGDFGAWAEARAASRGYEADGILERVVAATRRVRDGEAAYERDGVTFAQASPDRLLIEMLRRASKRQGGPVGVLDFGGSLGSVYWQNRQEWGAGTVRRWGVVEQAQFVKVGRREFESAQLRFFETVEAAVAAESPEVLLLSGVLQYLEAPHAQLRELLKRRFAAVAVMRTGFVQRPTDRLAVQQVPRSIYAGSYPCWFFDRKRLMAHFTDYELVAEADADEGRCEGVEFKHLLFELVP